MDRSKDRLKVSEKRILDAGFSGIERFSAYDGSLPENEPKFEQKQMSIFNISPSQKGCFLSHLDIWQKIADGIHDYRIVFEDDIIFHSKFQEIWSIYLEQIITNKYDFVLLGYTKIPIPDNMKNDLLLNDLSAGCTHSYILSKNGAKRLLELYEKFKTSRNFNKKKYFMDGCCDSFTQYIMEGKFMKTALVNGNMYECDIHKCNNVSRNAYTDSVREQRAGGLIFQSNLPSNVVGYRQKNF